MRFSCLRPLSPALCAAMASLLVATFGHAQTRGAAAPADGYEFANGIAAVVEDRIITVDDIRQRIAPLIPELQAKARNEREFNEELLRMQDEILQEQIDRVLIVKDFFSDEKRNVPASFVDNQIAETIASDFDGDRSKYLAYLRSRGISQKDYRREVQEDMVYGYMRQQQRKSASTLSPVRIQTYYDENKERFYQEDQAHLRLIQFTRGADDTDETLRAKAAQVIDQLNAGASFVDLARLYSQDSRRTKGGDWGMQRKSDLRPEFADVLFTLEKGQHSEPIIMPEGAFILYVEERKHAGILPIDEVRPQIESMLQQQFARQAQERWLEKLRRNGYVKHY